MQDAEALGGLPAERKFVAAPSSPDPRDYLIVALDVPTATEALKLAEKLGDHCRWVKVGMELFYSEGRSLVTELRNRNLRIFLDLKLHDIPNTVASAIHSLGPLNIDLLTIHASGGPAMLQAASSAASALALPPTLAAVTVLTSMNHEQLKAVGVDATPAHQVTRLAHLSFESGFRALITSPLEVRSLRDTFGADPVLIVPGIRLTGSAADDQSRIATPRAAISEGASFLVVGRPITRSDDPSEATKAVLHEIASGLEDRMRSKQEVANR